MATSVFHVQGIDEEATETVLVAVSVLAFLVVALVAND
jgi:hypothetical protein